MSCGKSGTVWIRWFSQNGFWCVHKVPWLCGCGMMAVAAATNKVGKRSSQPKRHVAIRKPWQMGIKRRTCLSTMYVLDVVADLSHRNIETCFKSKNGTFTCFAPVLSSSRLYLFVCSLSSRRVPLMMTVPDKKTQLSPTSFDAHTVSSSFSRYCETLQEHSFSKIQSAIIALTPIFGPLKPIEMCAC